MVQVLPPRQRKQSFAEQFLPVLVHGLEAAGKIKQMSNLAAKEKEEKAEKLAAAGAMEEQGFPKGFEFWPKPAQDAWSKQNMPEKPYSTQEDYLKMQKLNEEVQNLQQKRNLTNELSQNLNPETGLPAEQIEQPLGMEGEPPKKKYPALHPQKKIEMAALINPSLARAWEADNKAIRKEMQHDEDIVRKEEETKHQHFLEERKYHTDFSKESEKNADLMRNVIPKKEMSLQLARDAVETGNLGYFSPDKLADATGVDAFRTAKGAQLLTAGKENLLTNMGRVSARAQNIWFEQRLNSMFPKIGQSKEANLTVQEMLEGELEMDKSYLEEFDRLRTADQENYGYVLKDIDQRARNNTKSIEKQILNRTSYRMKEIEEKEKGPSEMSKNVGKKVPRGTPLTLSMAKLYKNKFGDKALKMAEENGYHVPTIDEYKYFSQSLRE